MKTKSISILLSVLGITAMLTSCSSTSNTSLSFSKRKYTKGYFVDAPASANSVVTTNASAAIPVEKRTTETKATQPEPLQQVTALAVSSNAPALAVQKVKIRTTKSISLKEIASSSAKTNNNNADELSNAPASLTSTASITDTKQTTGGNSRSWVVALVLCIFLGPLGIHRFYLGYIGLGVLELLTGGLFGILWIIDLIRIIVRSLQPKDGSYND